MTARNIPHLVSFLLALCLFSQEAFASCDEQYQAAYDPAPAALECTPFPGSPTLHGIVYGCNGVNQDEEPPAGVVTQSFTQMCIAAVTSDTNFTCYDMAADTDYTEFISSVDTSLTCVAGDESETPIFRYIETTGTFSFGGAQGNQVSGGDASAEFDAELAAGVYYAATIMEGEPLQTNAPDNLGMTNSSDMSGNETDAPGGGDAGTDAPGGDGDAGTDAPGGDGDDSSSESFSGRGGMIALLSMTVASWISVSI